MSRQVFHSTENLFQCKQVLYVSPNMDETMSLVPIYLQIRK